MGLNTTDFAIIGLYLAGITLFGLRFRKKQRTLRDYFLAGREIPWWAISLSIVAAETSTLTIISIPGLAYDTNLTFLQVVIGYVVGRIVISFVLLPQYFRGDLYTAYELIERRFGRGTSLAHRRTISSDSCSGRRSSRLRGVDRGLDRVGDRRGRIDRDHHRIDTDLYIRGRPGGGDLDRRGADRNLCRRNTGRAVHDSPPRSRRMECDSCSSHGGGKVPGLQLQPRFLESLYILGWANRRYVSHHGQPWHRSTHRATPARCAGTKAIRYGAALQRRCDSVSVRIVPDRRRYAVGLLPCALVSFGRPDRIYPTFIVTRMPHGISGLLIAAILAAAMSNLSAALNSLSSSAIMDFYARFRPQSDEKTKMRLSRWATLLWALVLFGLAIIALHKVGRVVEVGLQIASIAYGALLGAFLLGTLTRRANQLGAMIGMACGFSIELYLWLGTRVPWTWWVTIGTCTTFAVGWLASFVMPNGPSTTSATAAE